MQEKIIRLAALLHDIGKFWQGVGESGTHAELSSMFIQDYVPKQWREEAAGVVSLHHDCSKYKSEGYKQLKTIVCADWLSSGERREFSEKSEKEERGRRKDAPLMSIFSEIGIGKGKPTSARYYPIKKLELNEEVIFPNLLDRRGGDRLTGDYNELWGDFVREVEGIRVITDFDAYFNTIYYLLQKYMWCVPSVVWAAKPNISLFDHLKTTCAIASCLSSTEEKYLDNLIRALSRRYEIKKELKEKGMKVDELSKKLEKRWNKEAEDREKEAFEEEKFLLIGGDVSGVQKFIYSITSKGAAKGLRGRSFYLELLSETIARFILMKLTFPVANLLYCGGGHFFILAPSTARGYLERLPKTIAQKMLDSHRGELYLVLKWIPLSSSDFVREKFGGAWMRIGEEITRSKKKKFAEILEMPEKIFGPFDEGGLKDFCKVCGSEEYVKEEGQEARCEFCKSLEDLAKKLSEAKYVVETINEKGEEEEKKGSWKDLLANFGFRYEFLKELGEEVKEIKAEHLFIYKLNDTDMGDCLYLAEGSRSPISFGFEFLAKETPLKEIKDMEGKVYEWGIKDFDELAGDAEGIKRWSVLRGDVDNLGKIFSQGLGEERTISGVSTLSSMLSLFFRGWVEKISENGKYKDRVYAIYSGGDDFFMVGSWDKMLEIGKKIYKDFKDFTCENPNIALSAGITIAPSKKYPLYQVADLAGEALDDKSKGMKGKDSITFLDIPMKWDKFSGEISELKENLNKLLEADISRGFLQKLNEIYGEYDRQRSKHGEILAKYDDRYRRWRWLLAYVIGRTKISKEKKELLKETEGLISKNIEYLPVAVRWVEFLTRKEGGERR